MPAPFSHPCSIPTTTANPDTTAGESRPVDGRQNAEDEKRHRDRGPGQQRLAGIEPREAPDDPRARQREQRPAPRGRPVEACQERIARMGTRSSGLIRTCEMPS